MQLDSLSTRALPAGHLPLIRACMDRIGLKQVVDDHLPRHPLAHASDAECVMAMVLNILSGRMALWRMDQWLQKLDTELIMGSGVDAAWFHNTRLGQCLDRLDAVGTDRLLGDVVTGYLERENVPRQASVHLDTTTVSVFGAYDLQLEPTPLRGFSKDHRPDLKQLVFGLAVHGSVGVPLTLSVANGNTSDHASFRDHLAKLAALLPDPEEITVVADCKVVDAETLGRLMGSGFQPASLVPNSFGLRAELVEQAWTEQPEVGTWPLLSEKAAANASEKPQRYRGWSQTARIGVRLGNDPADGGTLSDEELRFLVVHSDRLVGRFDEALPDRLKREHESLQDRAKSQGTKGLACEEDARRAGARVAKAAHLHNATVEVQSEVRTLKRSRRGRPKAGEVAPTKTVWHFKLKLVPDEEAIATARRKASCFVLITDWDAEEWTDIRVLDEYRHQSVIEGHTGFRWLKGPGSSHRSSSTRRPGSARWA